MRTTCRNWRDTGMSLLTYVSMGLLFLISLVVSLVCLWLVQSSIKLMRSLISHQQGRIQDLTNLVVAKDLGTYQSLQHTKTSAPLDSNTDPLLIQRQIVDSSAMDDSSVAARLSKQYEESGLDPALAYDAATFTEEFGGEII